MSFTFYFQGKPFPEIGNTQPLTIIAGPCAIESRSHALEVAQALKEIFNSFDIPFIYKSSFDKANRSSKSSYRGPGLQEGLQILADVRESVKVPVLTDVHSVDQVEPVAEVVDMLQTPAFLCRQTDLIEAAAAAGKPLNIKKGQFLAPWEMANVLKKAISTGNNRICLCERGTSFGYGNLVVDMRSLKIMSETGAPVIFDATHSVQLPGAQGDCSGGQREFVPLLARSAVAAGIAGIFMEVHPDPDKAPCDGPNMLAIQNLPALLKELKSIDEIVKDLPTKIYIKTPPSYKKILQNLPQSIKDKLRRIRLLVTDVDGILTDGGIYFDNEGECIKKFNSKDGLGIKLLKENGIEIAILSGRSSEALKRRIYELGIEIAYFGRLDKRTAINEIINDCGISADEIAYLGDDITDLSVKNECAILATVQDGHIDIQENSDFILNKKGGEGALREFIDLIINIKNKI